MQSYTVDTLIDSARRRGQLPRAAGTMNTADLVEVMNEELQTYMTSFLVGLQVEYLTATYDLTITAGVTEYLLPAEMRALGGQIRMASVQDGSSFRKLTWLEPERINDSVSTSAGSPQGFYFNGNKIGFLPNGDATVRLKYFKRPGKLVLEEDAAQVVSINTGAHTVTVDTVPLEWTASETLDIVAAAPQFDTLAQDKACTIAGSVITFPATLPTELQVGDWIALAGESPIPQIPEVTHYLLAQRTAAKALESKDAKQAAMMSAAALESEKRAQTLLVGPRNRGSPRIIVNHSGPGWRYGGRIRY